MCEQASNKEGYRKCADSDQDPAGKKRTVLPGKQSHPYGDGKGNGTPERGGNYKTGISTHFF